MLRTSVLVPLVLTIALLAPAIARADSDVAEAAARGDRAALRALVAAGADVNAARRDSSTALHWAVYRQDHEAIELLLQAGADVGVATRAGATPLSMAAEYGDARAIERLLRAGADATVTGSNGETMLMLASRSGSVDAIRLFVDAGVDVNAVEPLRGTNALMWAVNHRHADAVRVLLAAGADPSRASGPAGLPRNYLAPRVNVRAVEEAQRRRERAVAAGRTYDEQLEWEYINNIDLGGPRNAYVPDRSRQAQAGQDGAAAPGEQAAAAAPGPAPAPEPQAAPAPAPVLAAAAPAEAGATAETDLDDDPEVIVAGLVGGGGGGLTPLIFAAREGDIESARALLEGGADVNQRTNYGWTPLLTAVNNRNYQLAKLLIEHGADVNIPNDGGWTPLYLATDNRNIEGGDYPVPEPDMDHLELIRLLLANGAEPDARARDNTLTRTIFTMQWFFEDGATPFIRAAQSSDKPLLQLLLEFGADPLARTAHGDTALTAAAGIGWVEGVTYERSVEENFEVVKMLLDLGIDPNAANNEGRTALMGAALKGRPEVVQLLVDRGATLEARDRGSRDTHIPGATIAGITFQAVDYADGLVRVGVQSAVERPETAALLRQLMRERGLPVPDENRSLQSICVVPICQ
jgi:uncharacterized protein